MGVEPIMVRLLTYLAGLPLYFLPAPDLYALLESIDVAYIPAGGERPGGSSKFRT